MQVLFDLATCFLIADMARRLVFRDAPAQAAFLLAALCPFLANYAAAALTETLEIFFTALALDWRLRGLGVGEAETPAVRPALAGLRSRRSGAQSCSGRMAEFCWPRIGGYLLWLLAKSLRDIRATSNGAFEPRTFFWAGVLVAVGALSRR